MKITLTYPATGVVRVHKVTQAEANRMITYVSTLQDFVGEVAVKITVEED